MTDRRRDWYERLEDMLRWPMALLAIVFTLAFVAELDRALDPRCLFIAMVAQDVIWVLFALEYLTLLALAPDRRLYFRTHLLELVSVVVPAFRMLRIVRALRLVPVARVMPAGTMAGRGLKSGRRLLRRRVVAYAVLSLVLVVLIGAAAMLMAERQVNPSLGDYRACLWWSAANMTAVGYGDVFPVTPLGKALTMLLMITGIGLMGVVTAAIASFFVEIEREDEDAEVRARLEEMTRMLAVISEQVEELRRQTEQSGAA